MGKNKNNQPIWNTRIKKEKTNLFKKVGGSISIDKRLFREDIEASIVHVEMLFKQKIINFKIYKSLALINQNVSDINNSNLFFKNLFSELGIFLIEK